MTTHAEPVFDDLEEYLADIGDRVRAERQARRWTHTELGRRASMSVATVKRLENGETSLSGFVRACAALGIPMDQLLSDEWTLPVPAPSLTVRQVEVLSAVADGRSLSAAAPSLGMTSRGLASVLSGIYRRLGVADVARDQRRQAAVRVASTHGLFDAA